MRRDLCEVVECQVNEKHVVQIRKRKTSDSVDDVVLQIDEVPELGHVFERVVWDEGDFVVAEVEILACLRW